MESIKPKIVLQRAWLLASAGISIILVGRLFGLIELFVLGTCLVVLVILAVLTVVMARARIEIQRTFDPARPSVGETLDVEVILSASVGMASCQVVETVDGRAYLSLTPAKSWRDERSRTSYRLPLTHRGVVSLGPASIQIFDPFGIARIHRVLGTDQEVLVIPQSVAIDLPQPGLCRGNLIDQMQRELRNRSSNSEFHSIRDYQVGDDVRRVNWKASAKREDLVVNQYQSLSPIDLHLVIDNQTSRYRTEGFEVAISIATSFARQAECLDRAVKMNVGFTVEAEIFRAVQAAEMPRLLKRLALAELTQVVSIAHVRRRSEDLNIDVIITGIIDPTWIHSVWTAHGSAKIVVIIACEKNEMLGDFPPHWILVQCPTLEAFTRFWSTLSSRRLIES